VRAERSRERETTMNLPSVEECHRLFGQYHIPKNIFEHCKKVSKLAALIAKRLKSKGIAVDVEQVRIGALMHDFMKAVTFKELKATAKFNYTPTAEETKAWQQLRKRFPEKKHESEITYELLKDKFHEFAKFLLHEGALSTNLSLERKWEEKVIHYADWRVLGTSIITLDQRLDDFRVRYAHVIGDDEKKWNAIQHAERKAEKEICDALSVSARELTI